jgi:hypothetical protein
MFESRLRPATHTTAMETGEPINQIDFFNSKIYVCLINKCDRAVVNIFKRMFYDSAFVINLDVHLLQKQYVVDR